jgi:hypothetical protein
MTAMTVEIDTLDTIYIYLYYYYSFIYIYIFTVITVIKRIIYINIKE